MKKNTGSRDARNSMVQSGFNLRPKVAALAVAACFSGAALAFHCPADMKKIDEAISKNLGIMDATAFALCRDQKLPINVFSIFKPQALKRVVMGEDEGTMVHV